MPGQTQKPQGTNLAEGPQEFEVPARGIVRLEYKAEEQRKERIMPPEPDMPPKARATLQQLEKMDRAGLRKWMQRHLSEEELATTMFDLNIDTSTFRVGPKSVAIRELIDYCERREIIDELLVYLAKEEYIGAR